MLAEIVLSKTLPKLDKIYHYEIPENLSSIIKIGHQVQVPFGNGERIGYVVGFVEESDIPNLKSIGHLAFPNPVFTEIGLSVAKWMAEYYCSSFSSTLRSILPPGVRRKEVGRRPKKLVMKLETGNRSIDIFSKTNIQTSVQTLTQSQENAINKIKPKINQPLGEVFLLTGLPSSGKTEVYLKVVEEAYKNDRGSIVLVPEIGLTPQLLQKFREKFADSISIIHSGLTDKERNIEWGKILGEKAKIVIGTRLAIFAPVKDLKVLILDEEYETTYKQEQNPRYHARTVAEFLSKNHGIVTILGSSTPSVESYFKAEAGIYKKVELKERMNNSPLPTIKIIDMRNEKEKFLSPLLKEEIKATLARGEKVILFINRRGFFTYQICRDCGETVKCPKCSLPLTYHFKKNLLECGHCGLTSGINIACGNCQGSSIAFLGIGTQRIEEEVGAIYPQAKIIRLDRDSVSKKGSHEEIIKTFTEGDANVLIGTQLVTKGIDDPKVTLVGVVSADSMINIPDFRAAEHTFQQIMQVAGRAGRHELPGKVFIQTLNPDHYAIRFAAAFDYDGFYREETKNREELNYPPYSELINIIVHGKDKAATMQYANQIKTHCLNLGFGSWDLSLLGPVAAPISKIKGSFRWQILLKGKEIDQMRKILSEALSKIEKNKFVTVSTDIEPMDLL